MPKITPNSLNTFSTYPSVALTENTSQKVSSVAKNCLWVSVITAGVLAVNAFFGVTSPLLLGLAVPTLVISVIAWVALNALSLATKIIFPAPSK